jgi:hypothetical protein
MRRGHGYLQAGKWYLQLVEMVTTLKPDPSKKRAFHIYTINSLRDHAQLFKDIRYIWEFLHKFPLFMRVIAEGIEGPIPFLVIETLASPIVDIHIKQHPLC